MIATNSDWGDPGFTGDYPALRSGTEPSAPGKRAKRTFNKHQHALQQLVAETVVLQPTNGVRGPSKPQLSASHTDTGVMAKAKDIGELVDGIGRSKKRKRDVAGSCETPNSPARLQEGAAVTAGAGHAATVPSAKATRQRNKFKAHLGKTAPVSAALGADAAYQRPGHAAQTGSQLKQSSAGGAMGTHKRQSDVQPSGGSQANVIHAAHKRKGAGEVKAVPGTAAASAVHETAQQRSNGDRVFSGAEQRARKGKEGGLTKRSKERRKADKRSRAQVNSTTVPQEPCQHSGQQHGHQPDASPPPVAAADAQPREVVAGQAIGRKRKKQRTAPAGRVEPSNLSDQPPIAGISKSTRQEAAIRTAAHAEAGDHAAARHAKAAGPVQSTGQKSVRQAGGSTPALDRMRERLQGGRFRWLNEQMYSLPGEQSYRIMQEDPDLYQQYHEGFRQQTAGWPRQPVEVAIEWLQGKPAGWRVADFGCGDARVARNVEQEVHSFDLVATAPGVVACNMAAVPLDDASLDAAIFCLALMGTDYGSFLQEAHRVLRKGGWLWIAEVRSRFAGMVGEDSATNGSSEGRAAGGEAQQKVDKFSWVNLAFQHAMRQLGFKLVSRDAGNKMFVIMQFRKGGQSPAESIQWPQLKACVYRRR